ncbi:MAG: hypothetical protein HY961_05755 [Ignavibacteriae bacterium]|nr:hypothetical protein [Ignavibacteriota bacterium]
MSSDHWDELHKEAGNKLGFFVQTNRSMRRLEIMEKVNAAAGSKVVKEIRFR